MSPLASGPCVRICPLCEGSRLVFSGLYSVRCPACGCEPSGDFLETLHQIVALPEPTGTSHRRPDRDSEPESLS